MIAIDLESETLTPHELVLAFALSMMTDNEDMGVKVSMRMMDYATAYFDEHPDELGGTVQ